MGMMRWICNHWEENHKKLKYSHPKWFVKILNELKYCPICGMKEPEPKL